MSIEFLNQDAYNKSLADYNSLDTEYNSKMPRFFNTSKKRDKIRAALVIILPLIILSVAIYFMYHSSHISHALLTLLLAIFLVLFTQIAIILILFGKEPVFRYNLDMQELFSSDISFIYSIPLSDGDYFKVLAYSKIGDPDIYFIRGCFYKYTWDKETIGVDLLTGYIYFPAVKDKVAVAVNINEV